MFLEIIFYFKYLSRRAKMSDNNDIPPAYSTDNNDIPPYAPPAYSRIDYNQHNIQIQHNGLHSSHNVKLPTYEEVQLEKILNEEPISAPTLRNAVCVPPIQNEMTFIAIENGGDDISDDNSLLGTDIVFVTAFFVSFIFNWIGFLMLTCFCNTIAGRYGGWLFILCNQGIMKFN